MTPNNQHEDDQIDEPEDAQALEGSREADQGEDISDVPMLQEPRRLVGERDAQFTPAAFYALTRHQRRDIDPHDGGFFLVEESIDRIGKRGIPLGGEYYWSPELQEHVTGSSDVPTPNYFIRYDRALYARGTLDEVLLYREEPGGGRSLICRCTPREQAMEELDHEEFLHRRNQFFKDLQTKGALAEHEFNMLQIGETKYEELLDQQAARRRSARNHRPKPRPSAPIDIGDQEEREERDGHEDELTFGEERARERQRER